MEVRGAYGFIYITTNIINGKRYIGQRKFYRDWNSYLGSGKLIMKAIKKYGRDNFIRDIVAISYTKEELDKLEVEFISNYNAVNSDNFYNISSSATGGNGVMDGKTPQEIEKIRMKMSKVRTGTHHSLYTRKKMSDSRQGENSNNWRGGDIYYKCDYCNKTHHTNKYSYDNSINHFCSIECRNQSYRENLKGENAYWYGKTLSENTKEKISKSRKGKLKGKDAYWYGKTLSDNTKSKISESKRGKGLEDSNHNAKKVICLTTGFIFGCVKQASDYYNCNRVNISQCCKYKRKTCGELPNGTKLKWMYLSEYEELILYSLDNYSYEIAS